MPSHDAVPRESRTPSRSWRFENTAAKARHSLDAVSAITSPGKRLDLVTVLLFVATQELAFVLIYDVVRLGRAPSAALAITIGILAMSAIGWRWRARR